MQIFFLYIKIKNLFYHYDINMTVNKYLSLKSTKLIFKTKKCLYGDLFIKMNKIMAYCIQKKRQDNYLLLKILSNMSILSLGEHNMTTM